MYQFYRSLRLGVWQGACIHTCFTTHVRGELFRSCNSPQLQLASNVTEYDLS